VFPRKIEIEMSVDGENYQNLGAAETKIGIEDLTVQKQLFEVISNAKNTKARFIKIKAIQYGKLPEWHQGVGGDSFIFIDEIEVD
jgi:hypothetical protein